MNPVEAHYLALCLMAQHHLSPAWKLGFAQTQRLAGRCWLDRKVIDISEQFIRANDAAGVREIVLHEIAHALTKRRQHDRVWREVAKSIGCTGARQPDMLAQPRGRWRFECGKCGTMVERYRRLVDRRMSCRKCGGRKFDERYVLREVEVTA